MATDTPEPTSVPNQTSEDTSAIEDPGSSLEDATPFVEEKQFLDLAPAIPVMNKILGLELKPDVNFTVFNEAARLVSAIGASSEANRIEVNTHITTNSRCAVSTCITKKRLCSNSSFPPFVQAFP